MKNIVLIGFMGTGKTSVGKLLAQRLAWPFVDTDQLIEQEVGLPVKEIFRSKGETFFRTKESEIIARVSGYTDSVIATGGGAVINRANFNRLKSNSVVIALTASGEIILARTAGNKADRPLLAKKKSAASVEELLAARREHYRLADFTIDTSKMSPWQVAEEIIALLRPGGILYENN
mgnify:CR=1 FL=1